jgi:uncharacterized OsmC-like protein
MECFYIRFGKFSNYLWLDNLTEEYGGDPEVRNGFNEVRVTFDIDADASDEDIAALVAQSQKRSAVFDALTNPTNVTVSVA